MTGIPSPAHAPRRRAGALRATAAAAAAVLAIAVLFALSSSSGPQDAGYPAPAGAGPVGALFALHHGHPAGHFCTASVVVSPPGDLLITAAHCVTGVSLAPPGGLAFAPGYANGRFPGGLWQVTMKFVDSRWAAGRDPNDDVAFLVVKPLAGFPVSARSVQRADGAEAIRFDASLPTPIRAIGYPDLSEAPIECGTQAVAFEPESLNQVKFVCPGFTDGTSGGPMLSQFSPATGTGAIIGVIGGYQQGGNSPSISYSSAFTSAVRALYQRALRASLSGR